MPADHVNAFLPQAPLARRQFSRLLLAAACGGAVAPALAQSAAPMAAYFVFDYYSRKVLLVGNEKQKRPVASLTKIATTCVVLDWLSATGASIEDRATVPPSAAQLSPNPFNFQPGDSMTLRDALCCAMMGSDNIAAETLAWHVGQDLLRRTGRGSDPYSVFIRQMNMLAAKLGMSRTNFANPHGLDSGRTVPLSTAEDLARLSVYALNKSAFHFYMSQQSKRVGHWKASGTRQEFVLKNTNQLLGTDRIDGMKTGTTDRAGACLILTATRKNSVVNMGPKNTMVTPHRLVCIALACQDRFRDTRALLNQGWATYDAWGNAGRPVKSKSELLDGGPPAAAPQQ